MQTKPPNWMSYGAGKPPAEVHRFRSESQLTGFDQMLENGDYVAADDIGTVYRLDPLLNVSLLTRLQDPVRLLSWSETGEAGTAVLGNNTVIRLDASLKVLWTIETPFRINSIAIDPFGIFTAIASEDAGAIVVDDRGKRAATIETLKPLVYAKFLAEEPVLIAAAEHGLLGAYSVSGKKLWEEALWSNVGALDICQHKFRIYLAALNHGIQVFNQQGKSISGFVVEGTVNRVACSYRPAQLLASTIENQIYRLNPSGELLWAAAPPDGKIAKLFSNAIGTQAVAVFDQREVLLLDWS